MIHDTAYDTTMGSFMDLKLIVRSIREAIIRDAIYNQQLDLKGMDGIVPMFIMGNYSSEANIPFFTHPLLIEGDKNIRYLVSDIRPFVRNDQSNSDSNKPAIKNMTEFNIAKSRLILNMAWLNSMVQGIRNELSFASTVFASWLSEIIGKKYALDPKDQLVLNIMCHYYYLTLFTNETMDDVSLHKFSVHTIKATRAPVDLVIDTFSKIGDIRNINEFCSKVPEILENIRLKDFNVGILLTVIANSWYGLNSREILAVALEHPPTWCSLVYASLTERTFKNSMIARVSERYGKNGNADNFLKAYSSIVREFTVSSLAREELVILPFED